MYLTNRLNKVPPRAKRREHAHPHHFSAIATAATTPGATMTAMQIHAQRITRTSAACAPRAATAGTRALSPRLAA